MADENETEKEKAEKYKLLKSLQDISDKLYEEAYMCLMDRLNQSPDQGEPESCEKLDNTFRATAYIVNALNRINDSVKGLAQIFSIEEKYIGQPAEPKTQAEAEKKLSEIPPELLTKEQIRKLEEEEEQKKLKEIANAKKKRKSKEV